MKLEYIRSFIGVVNYKSFSLAAKYLYLSQPTISTHIKQLENELGVQLLIRSTKDVVLSEEGKVFYPYALQLVETENRVLMQLNKGEGETMSRVSLAVSSVPGQYLFPKFIAKFRKKNSSINFKIMDGDSSEVIQKILNYDAEIGIAGLNYGSDKIHSEVLFDDKIVLITPNTIKYRELNGKIPIEQLSQEWFITRENGSGTKNTVDSIEKELKLTIPASRSVVQLDSSELTIKFVEEGVGIAFISRLAAKEAIEKQKVLEFVIPNVNAKRKFYLMYHKERGISANAEQVIRALREFSVNNI